MRNDLPLAVGVDVGGTKIAVGLIDEQGRVVHSRRVPITDHQPESVALQIAVLVADLADEHGPGISGVGIGLPGYVSKDRRSAQLVPNLGWRDVQFYDLVHRHLKVPVILENDANAAAWAEFRFGAGRHVATMVLVTIGTGVGGGIVMDDRLIRGGTGMAGEVGHLTMTPGGRACGCGKLGCWEQYASGSALLRIAREHAGENRQSARLLLSKGDGTPEGVTGAHVTEAAQEGDPAALAAFDILAEHIAAGLADIVAVLDPELIVLGGGVSEAGDILLNPVEQAFRSNVVVTQQREGVALRLAQLKNDAGMIGAADLIRFT